MTLQQFLEKWNGEPCEVAGSANAKNQCVDLANAYLRDVCNHSIIEWTNACDFPSKIKDMEWIPNDEETDLPKEGDIIIWNSNVGSGAGHIAIFLDGTTSKFNSFDQNWPLYSPCHVQSHNYTNVIGWLRPIINSNTDMTLTDEQKRILDFIGTRTEGDVREAFGALADKPNKDEQIRILNERISFYETKIKELESTVDVLNRRIEDYSKTIDDWQSDFRTANEQLTKTLEDLDKMTTEKADYRRRYEDALSKSVDKYSAIELITLGVKKLFIK